MNASLRATLVISLALHAALFAVIGAAPAAAPLAVPAAPLSVDYVVLPVDSAAAEAAAAAPVVVSVPTPSPVVPPLPAVPAKTPDANQPAPPKASPDAAAARPHAAGAAATRETAIKATKDYLDYNHLVREKIRTRVSRRYRDAAATGDIRLIFVLHADGTVASVAVDPASSGSERLAAVATASVREAAPYPPFPKAMDLPQMSFTLTITFKKR